MRLKTFIAVCAIVGICGWRVGAQLTGNQRIGAYAGGGGMGINTSSFPLGVKQSSELKQSILKGHPYRKISGEICNMYSDGWLFFATVRRSEPNGILTVNYGTKVENGTDYETYAIKNFQGEIVSGHNIAILAKRVGTYNLESENSVVELYDCGTILSPEEESQQLAKEKSELNSKLKAEATARAAASQEKAKIANAAKASGQEKTFVLTP